MTTRDLLPEEIERIEAVANRCGELYDGSYTFKDFETYIGALHPLTVLRLCAAARRGLARDKDADIRPLAQALVTKLRRIFDSPEYLGTFAIAQIHGSFYKGENCEHELDALDAALSAEPVKERK